MRDFSYALRQLRKNGGFTAVVLLTLGLCIGANTAIYCVLDAVLFRPLPYPDADRLAMLITEHRQNGALVHNLRQTGALFEAVRDSAPGLETAAYSPANRANFSGRGQPRSINQQRVSAGYFHALGTAPIVGREFSRAEDRPNGPTLAVISYDFWQSIFHGDASVIGSAIRLRGEPYVVIGVMPQSFRSSVKVDLWTPLHPTLDGEGAGTNYYVVARLKPGVTWPEAGGQLLALSRALMEMPRFPHQYKDFEERLIPFHAGLTENVRGELWITWAAVLAVLLIGCVNIAGLLLARSALRQKEIATRLAVGGSRLAIVWQLLVESLLLALGGCGVGLLVGAFAIEWLKGFTPASFEMVHPIALNFRVAAAMAGIAILTSLIFGLAPAIRACRVDIRSVLIESGRGVAGTRRQGVRRFLVAGQVALSLVLLMAAGLMVRTLNYLYGLNPGFDARGIISTEASLMDKRFETRDAVTHLFDESLRQIRGIPGVRSAAVALSLPYERPLNYGVQQLDGFKGEPPQAQPNEVVYVTPGYFATLSLPLTHGRDFRDGDQSTSGLVAIVSESYARRHFGSARAALGGHLGILGAREIVGVAGDVQQNSGLDVSLAPITIEPTIYLPVAQTSDGFLRTIHTWLSPKWVIRTASPVGRIAPQVQAAVTAAAGDLPTSSLRTLDELEGATLQQERYMAALFSLLAALGLTLAGVGLFGLISNTVTQRRHELGVRLALGATAADVIASVVKPALALALAGIVCGAILSRMVAGLVVSLIWGVRPGDPQTFLATAGILLAVAFVASVIPALRILWLDPAQTLRNL